MSRVHDALRAVPTRSVRAATKAEQRKPVRLREGVYGPGGSSSVAPLRPASAAVEFLRHFEHGLRKSPAVLRERSRFMHGTYLDFFRANPALFHEDLRQAYRAPLLRRPAPQVLIGADTHL